MIVLIALLLAAPAPATIHRFAFLVGENNGGTGRPQLRYSVSDAESLAAVLHDLGGVQPEDEVVLREPSADDLRRAWQAFRDKLAQARTADVRLEVVFYYSGHSDEQGLLLAGARLEYDELRALLDSAAADVRIAILDSCDSGAFVRQKGGTRRPAFMSDASARAAGHAFITSSSASEAAQESDTTQGSFFTTAFVTGLRGAADSSGDGRVTLNEAYQFAFHETLAATERSRAGAQHASYDIQLSGSGDVVLTELRPGDARIILSAPLSGHLTVRDQEGRLLVELEKHGGAETSLALPPGKYVLSLERDSHFSEARSIIAEGNTAHISYGDFSPTSALTATRKGTLTLRPIALGLLPFATSNLGRDDILNLFSLNLIAGRTPYLYGLELSFVANYNLFEMRGMQAAFAANVARGDADGLQLAFALNDAGNLAGMQIGAINVAGGGGGVQLGDLNVAKSLEWRANRVHQHRR